MQFVNFVSHPEASPLELDAKCGGCEEEFHPQRLTDDDDHDDDDGDDDDHDDGDADDGQDDDGAKQESDRDSCRYVRR